MPAILTSWALIWATVVAALVPQCSASLYYNETRYGAVQASAEQDIYSAEYDAMLKHGESEEGEVFESPLVAT